MFQWNLLSSSAVEKISDILRYFEAKKEAAKDWQDTR
jgi:hypothetical protein